MFQQAENGLYCLDTTECAKSMTLVSTVAEKRSNYTNRDYSQAKLARKLQYLLGNPSTKQFVDIVASKQLPNCPITVKDVRAAEDLFGPSLPGLLGKTTQCKPSPVKTKISRIPLPVLERYREVILSWDVMKINGNNFLVCISHNIRFGTAVMLDSGKIEHMAGKIRVINKLYKQRGFVIVEARMDGHRTDASSFGGRWYLPQHCLK